MTTAWKLWIGFGTLSTLLVVSLAVISARLRSISQMMGEMHRAGEMAKSARDVESTVLMYALAVDEYLSTHSIAARRKAVAAARHTDQHRSDLEVSTANHEAGIEGRTAIGLWRELHAIGESLMTRRTPASSTDLRRFSQLRENLARHLDRQIEVGVEIFESRVASASQDIQVATHRTRFLFLIGLGIATATSVVVSRAVVKSEAKLRESDRRKDDFLAVLAHELRNPLVPVRNSLHIMRQRTRNSVSHDRKLLWSIDVIERQVRTMTRLVDDLLDVSRISRGILELRKERLQLASIVEAVVEASRPLIDECGHELLVTLPPEPAYLDGDLTRLSQTFSNLLNNAANYTERQGLIRLSARVHGKAVVVSVVDTGAGISPELLDSIFEPFVQANSDRKQRPGGLGIGLSLVKHLVELHGGSVEAHSDGLDQGSEFNVRLPVVNANSGPFVDASRSTTNHPVVSPLRILVADDDPLVASTLEMLLQMMGHEVRSALDGQQAVMLANEFRPDAALLDIGMPKLNGCEAASRIRATHWGKEMVLIAHTGWGRELDRKKSTDAGFDQHIVKPADPDELVAMMYNLAREKCA